MAGRRRRRSSRYDSYPKMIFDLHSMAGIFKFIIVIVLVVICLVAWIYCMVIGGENGGKVLLVEGIVSGILLLGSLALCFFVGYENNTKQFFLVEYLIGIIMSMIGLYIAGIQTEMNGVLRFFVLMIESAAMVVIPAMLVCWLRYAFIKIMELFTD